MIDGPAAASGKCVAKVRGIVQEGKKPEKNLGCLWNSLAATMATRSTLILRIAADFTAERGNNGNTDDAEFSDGRGF
jgi:hypothetical protein